MEISIKNNFLCFTENGKELTCINLDKYINEIRQLIKENKQYSKIFVRQQKYKPRYFEIIDNKLYYIF